jgi:hypothetical protein
VKKDDMAGACSARGGRKEYLSFYNVIFFRQKEERNYQTFA